jgi:5'-deoxynucleotidase YfbR-like HD superfamily hydrolase
LAVASRLTVLLHDAGEYVLGEVICPFKAVIGDGYTAVEARLSSAIYLRFGLPAEPSASLKRIMKRSDRRAMLLALPRSVAIYKLDCPWSDGIAANPRVEA